MNALQALARGFGRGFVSADITHSIPKRRKFRRAKKKTAPVPFGVGDCSVCGDACRVYSTGAGLRCRECLPGVA